MGLQNTEWYFHIVVHNSSWNDYISNATALLERLREHGLTAGPKEVFFFYGLIGYQISWFCFGYGLNPTSFR